MAVKVKVNRLKLLQECEAAKERARKNHEKAVTKYERDLVKARKAAATDLRKKAIGVDTGAVAVYSETVYTRQHRSIACLAVESKVKLPRYPEAPDTRPISRLIHLLKRSDEDTISLSEADLPYTGVTLERR